MGHELRGPAEQLRNSRSRAAGEEDLCVAAGKLFDKLPHRADRAPEQARSHGGGRCRAQRRRRLGQFGHLDLRQEIGELVQCPGGHGDARQDRAAKKAPSAPTRSTVIAEPTSTTTAFRPDVRRRFAATASSKRSTPTMSGRGSRTLSGRSPDVSSMISSSQRCSRSQSINREAAGRFTLPMCQRAAIGAGNARASVLNASQFGICSNPGSRPSRLQRRIRLRQPCACSRCETTRA